MLRFLLFLGFALTARAQEFTVERNVEYGQGNGKPLLLDVFRPKEPAQRLRSAVIVVHGGGWIAGSKEGMRGFAEPIVRAGHVCFNINYRLVFGLENTWPTPLDDVQRAVRWVRSQAAKYGVDPERIGAVGASAGGHLVSFLGTMDTRDNSDAALAKYSSRVQCVVNLYGPTALYADFIGKVDAGLASNDLVTKLLGGAPTQKPEVARSASPLCFVNARSAPFLIFHGRFDSLVPVEQSEWMQAALKKAGVEAKLVMFEDEGHGWKKKANNDRTAAEIMSFLARHLVK